MTELEGRTIERVRPMTEQEIAQNFFHEPAHGRPPALELDDGTVLFPSRDAEGNGPGELFGTGPGGEEFVLMFEGNGGVA